MYIKLIKRALSISSLPARFIYFLNSVAAPVAISVVITALFSHLIRDFR